MLTSAPAPSAAKSADIIDFCVTRELAVLTPGHLSSQKKISFSTFSRGSPEFPLLSLFGPKFADSAGAITWKGEADAGVFAASADVASCWKQMLRTLI